MFLFVVRPTLRCVHVDEVIVPARTVHAYYHNPVRDDTNAFNVREETSLKHNTDSCVFVLRRISPLGAETEHEVGFRF